MSQPPSEPVQDTPTSRRDVALWVGVLAPPLAWLLQLHLEAERHSDRRWGAELDPLARAFAERFKLYLPTRGN